MNGDDELLFPFPANEIIKKEEDFFIPPEEPLVIDPQPPLPFEPLTGATLSEDRIYRYVLWRRIAEKGKTCVMIGVNPSTADEVNNDPTISREESFIRSWGYALLVKVNLFAFRDKDPKSMRRAHKSGVDTVGPDNDRHILEQCRAADLVVCVWGNNGGFKKRDAAVLELLKNIPLYTIGLTKRGFPRHTLFSKSDLKPVLWKGCTEEDFTIEEDFKP